MKIYKNKIPNNLISDQCSLISEHYDQRSLTIDSNSSLRSAVPYYTRCEMLNARCLRQSRRAAFSLIEILVAIFVLSIGLLMIAGVFPIAVKWTSQDAQSTIAQVIAKNAVAQIEAQYTGNPTTFTSTYSTFLNGTAGYGPFCYSYGNNSPYPSTNPAPAAWSGTTPPPGNYYWSAYILAGASGAYPNTQSNVYTIYVFVFNKGDLSNTFTASGTPAMLPVTQSGTSYYPQLAEGTLSSAIGSSLPIGSQGLDLSTGQVFRAIVDSSGNYTVTSVPSSTTSPNPNYTAIDGHSVLYAPPAINQTASPLIYIYVTTVQL